MFLLRAAIDNGKHFPLFTSRYLAQCRKHQLGGNAGLLVHYLWTNWCLRTDKDELLFANNIFLLHLHVVKIQR